MESKQELLSSFQGNVFRALVKEKFIVSEDESNPDSNLKLQNNLESLLKFIFQLVSDSFEGISFESLCKRMVDNGYKILSKDFIHWSLNRLNESGVIIEIDQSQHVFRAVN
jgi:hypothetical protein